MKSGIVFDINEFAVHDGPGIRTTVFLKGCPLKCKWCHNPEGLSKDIEILKGVNGCIKCKKCEQVCKNEKCINCGKCVVSCPKNLIRFAGEKYTSTSLAEKILKNKDFMDKNGGVTFTGGEPLFQHEFLFETLEKLPNTHKAIETSGYTTKQIYKKMLSLVDFVLTDIKLVNDEKHLFYTGVSNKCILDNLKLLKSSNIPFIIRVPLIPGVNDNIKEMECIAELVKGECNLVRVELLKYNNVAGAKYELLGKKYEFVPNNSGNNIPELANIFESKNIPVFLQ